jgi:integrase
MGYVRAVAYIRTRRAADGTPRYECCWRDRATNRERSKTFRRKADAERQAKLVEADTIRGVAIPTPADGNRRVAGVVERWYELHSPRLKVKTRATYAGLLRARIIPALGDIRLAQLRNTDVQAWINHLLASGLSVSRVRQAKVLLAEALDWAVRDGLLAVNPARTVELPRLEKRERPWLEPDLIDAIAAACPPPSDLAVLLMGYQGLRFGEVAGLRRRNVDLLHRRLSVTDTVVEVGGRLLPDTPKSHQARIMPLVDHLVEPLRQHLESVPPDTDAYLLRGSRGAPLRYTHWLRTVWKPACSEVGVVGVTPHALRHSTGKMLANSGVPTVVIKLIMGHASASFTMDAYGHASEADLDAAADALDEYRQRTLSRRSVVRMDEHRATPAGA